MSLDSILTRRPPSAWDDFIAGPLRFLVRCLYSWRSSHADTNALGIVVVCVADTHNSHANIPPLPSGDILIHAGDLTQSGTVDETLSALEWLAIQPHSHKLFIAGNHDLALQDVAFQALVAQKYPSLTYLQNNYTSIQVNGRPLLVYGSPDTPRHGSWAFQYSRVQPHQVGASTVWQDIPDDVDILVTHGPPSFHLDLGGLGCLALLCRLWQVRPRLHVFGHIHASRGIDVMRWTPLQALYEKIMQGDRRFSTIARYTWHVVHTRRVEEPCATTLVNAAVVGGFRDEIINSAVAVCL